MTVTIELRGLVEALVRRYPKLGSAAELPEKYELFLNDVHMRRR